MRVQDNVRFFLIATSPCVWPDGTPDAERGCGPGHSFPPCGSRWTSTWTRGTLKDVLAAIEVHLVARRHVDLGRVYSAMCRRVG
jgi:hypothetical protein